MALYERLIHPDEIANPRIPVHQFMAAMSEFGRGAPDFDRASLIAAFELRVEDEADLDSLITKFSGLGTALAKLDFSRTIHDILLLAGEGIAYTTRGQFESRIAGY